MKKLVVLLLSCVLSTSVGMAQDTAKAAYIHRPVQISFAYPLSSNGYEAYKYVNVVSFGMLLNVAAGLEGAELSGLANVETDYVQGFQCAGLANYVGRTAQGTQVAGLANTVLQEVNAAQVAGLFNYAGSHVSGAQIAGLANASLGYTQGLQCGGLANYSQENMNGWQIAGLANVAKDMDGVQIGGLVNYARKVHGVQIGLVNIADTIERGLSLGLVSIVRKGGYSAFEISGSETMQPTLSFAIGTNRLYSIIGGGLHFGANAPQVISGFGMGTRKEFNDVSALQVEVIGNIVFPASKFNGDSLSTLYQLRLLYSHTLGDWISLFAGPVLNMYLSDVNKDGSTTPGMSPYTFYDKTFGSMNYRAWVGFQVGMRW